MKGIAKIDCSQLSLDTAKFWLKYRLNLLPLLVPILIGFSLGFFPKFCIEWLGSLSFSDALPTLQGTNQLLLTCHFIFLMVLYHQFGSIINYYKQIGFLSLIKVMLLLYHLPISLNILLH